MIYQEVIAEIQKDLKKSYVGFIFKPGKTEYSAYFAYYQIHASDFDDSESIFVSYEGGDLFNSSGEEEGYLLDEVPEEAKFLEYKSIDEFPAFENVSGLQSDYALFELFPQLPNPETLCTHIEKAEFVKLAAAIFSNL